MVGMAKDNEDAIINTLYIVINDINFPISGYSINEENASFVVTNIKSPIQFYETLKESDLEFIPVYNPKGEIEKTATGYVNIENFNVDHKENSVMFMVAKTSYKNLAKEIQDLKDELAAIKSIVEPVKTFGVSDGMTQMMGAVSSLAVQNFNDSTAVKFKTLYPKWSSYGYSYEKDDVVFWKEKLYRCLQSHSSQVSWMPDLASSLWAEIPDPNNDWPVFKQPTGATDYYKKGDKVTYKNKKYISLLDVNTLSPDQYPNGWKSV